MRVAATARRIINSAFGCAGERCMALPAICVEEEIADELVGTIIDLAKKLRMGPAWLPETDLGPMVTGEHRDDVYGWVDKGIEEGGELVLDGRGPVPRAPHDVRDAAHVVGPVVALDALG